VTSGGGGCRDAVFRACRAGSFFLFRQEKDGAPRPAPSSHRKNNTCLSFRRRPESRFSEHQLDPGLRRDDGVFSLCAYGRRLLWAPNGTWCPYGGHSIGFPLALCVVEQRRAQREKGRGLSEGEARVPQPPVANEQRRAPGAAGRRGGRAFFLGTSSWQDKKKFLACRRNTACQKPPTPALTSSPATLIRRSERRRA